MTKEPSITEKIKVRTISAAVLLFLAGITLLILMSRDQKARIIDYYLAQQTELSARSAAETGVMLRGISRAISDLDLSKQRVGAVQGSTAKALKGYLDVFASQGVRDLAVYRTDGSLIIGAGTYFNALAIPVEKHRVFLEKLKKSPPKSITLSDTAMVKGPGGEPALMALIAVPLSTQKLSATGVPSGYAVALVEFSQISSFLQHAPGTKGKRVILFAIDHNGLIISYPEQQFIGAAAQESFNLPKYTLMARMMEAMAAGKTGTASYKAPSRGGRLANTRWYAAFTPVKFGNNTWSVAVAFEDRDLPLVGFLARNFYLAGFFWLVVVGVAGMMLISDRTKRHELEMRLRRLADASAVSDILRSVNSELSQSKRSFDLKIEEIEALYHERTQVIEKIEEMQTSLFDSIRRPSQEQRNCIRELRRLTRKLEQLSDISILKETDEDLS